ncbi:siderophore-interacting protein [Roseixanthobacter glucoisosaccharinicivorans]|uniref:siderophore-interacting protein n=1 Tax=Roseixanthobacter glucoisosaccharinicivorans TaxID=3119923 RepID=UPI0037287A9B
MAHPRHSLFDVTAERVELVTPHMKRITVDGSSLPSFRPGLPAQWLKVFVPGAATGRAYTVRRFNRVSKRIELDFVLHGDNGPVSAWAARVQPGEAFRISGTHPRSGVAAAPAASRILLFGDETALPAVGSILETLPAHARAEAFVEVADASEEQAIESSAGVSLTWLHRGDATNGASLEAAAQALGRPPADTIIWIAAESSTVAALRRLALSEWGVDRSRLHAAGYWKRGEANHRDEDGSS